MIIWVKCAFRIKELRMTSAKMLSALRKMMEGDVCAKFQNAAIHKYLRKGGGYF
jgi:hypothetical protein